MELAADTAPSTPVLPEDTEITKVYQEYLQKSCEVGQILFQLEQIDSQRKEMEKNLEVTERARNKAAYTHRDLQKAKFAKFKPVEKEEPKLELKEEVTH